MVEKSLPTEACLDPQSSKETVPARALVGRRFAARGLGHVLGVVGTPVFNRVTGSFIFTWPVCLFVVHQVALNTVVHSDRRSDGGSPRRWQSWVAMAAALLLVGTCLAYFLICRRLSLATE